MLADWGMQPVEVDGVMAAEQAIRKARDSGRPFRAALLDSEMEEEDSARWEAIRSRLGPAAGIVGMMMTTTAAKLSLTSGSDEVIRLVKPIKQSELLHAVRQALGLQERVDTEEDPEQLDRPA
jgi:DNA-binding NtrC family response regulator